MPTDARPRVVAGLRLLAPVGQGAEGEVWEARDTRGRRRALKLIRPGALVDPDEVQRRGSWLVEVDHPALARVWRTGVLRGGGLDGWGFVEMAFVDGTSMQSAPPMPDALERLEPLAEALDLLHAGEWSQGVPLVHRDVKPANLIETPGGGLVLVDHSTLRAIGADTLTRIGTPVFAAPEVMSGRMGPPADVYSFCVTAVALLSGQRGERLAGLLADPDTLDVPEGLRAGLRQWPAQRPRSCRAALAVDGHEPTTWLPPAAGAGSPAGAGERDGEGEQADERTTVLDVPATVAVVPPEAASGPWAGPGTEPLTGTGAAGDGTDAGHGTEAGLDTEPILDAHTVAISPLAEAPPLDPAAGYGTGTVRYEHGATAPFEHGATAPFEPGTAPVDSTERRGPRRVLGWVIGLALLALTVPVLAFLEVALWPETVLVVAVVGLAHLLVHAVEGPRLASALLAPPLAWAFLLAERAAPAGRRRDWARPLLLGATVALSGALALTLRVLAGRVPSDRVARLLADVPGGAVTAVTALLAAVAAVALVAVCVHAARRGGPLLRLALLPVWLAGAGLLLAGGLLLAPLAVLAGRGRALLRLLGRTVTGAVAFARPDAPVRDPDTPAASVPAAAPR